MSRLFQKGIPLNISLKTLELSEDRDLQKIYRDLNSRCSRGEALFLALSGWLPKSLPVRLERFGELPNMHVFLTYMAQFLSEEKVFFEGLVEQMTYPLMLIFGSFLFFVFFLWGILPMYLAFFLELNLSIPWIITLFSSFSEILSRFWLSSVVGLVFLFFFMPTFFKWPIKRFKWWWSDLLVKSDLFFTIGLLMKSGFPLSFIVDGLEFNKDHVLYVPIKEFKSAFFQTGQFSISLFNHLGYSHYIHLLLSASETQDKLDDCILECSDLFRFEHKKKCDQISKFVPPISIIFIGGLVLLMSLIVFVPILNSLTGLL